MTRQGNVLSFDEARKTARGTRPSATVSKSAASKAFPKTSGKRNSDRFAGSIARSQAPSKSSAKKEKTKAQKNGSSLKMSKFSEFKRQHSKSKASREFTKQFGDTTSSAATSGPRAALYKGEMGRQHKKAAQMQQSGVQGGVVPRFASAFSWTGSPKLVTTLMISACILLSGAMLYPAAKQYYVTSRQHDQLVAEYIAIQQRNDDIQNQVDALSTSAGIEDRARAEFGWVKQGENAVIIYGLESSQQETTYLNTIPSGSVAAPETWYSPILDVIFGVE